MSKFSVLLKQLYKQKLRSKAFIITTTIYLVAIFAVAFWSDIKGLFDSKDEQAEQIALIVKTDMDVSNYFHSDGSTEFEVVENVKDIEKDLKNGDYLAAIELSDKDGKLAADIYSFDPLPLNKQEDISYQLDAVAQLYAMGQLNLTDEQSASLLDTAPILKMTPLNKEALEGKTTEEKRAGMFGSYAAGILIYIFVLSYLSIITTDVASEKGSRALEMLLVSVKPETHFRSKVFGIYLVAITQFVILFSVLFAVLKFKDGGAMWKFVEEIMSDLSPTFLIYVVLFLLLTILLFLIVGALFGSLVSKVEESSQVMTPAMIVIIIGFYIMIAAMTNPDTLLIKVFSYVPFTSGMVMPMRIGGTDMAFIEPLLSLGVLLATVIGLYLLSLTFYKRSVLTYSTGGILQKIKTVFKVTT
ncbi:ABC transporter permease [Lysinibacillus sp. 54212]|uniref:ABC transporter permease n=1 Tax=Lysinibacillus sp. 54212 TaxID=3119829 RepID=UPI002FCB7ADA